MYLYVLMINVFDTCIISRWVVGSACRFNKTTRNMIGILMTPAIHDSMDFVGRNQINNKRESKSGQHFTDEK